MFISVAKNDSLSDRRVAGRADLRHRALVLVVVLWENLCFSENLLVSPAGGLRGKS